MSDQIIDTHTLGEKIVAVLKTIYDQSPCGYL